jgi:hypothetical protein
MLYRGSLGVPRELQMCDDEARIEAKRKQGARPICFKLQSLG